MSYTHLQVHSGYSLLDSTIMIEELTKKADELGFKALALTDEQVLYGTIPFYKACRAHGIKPIIGMTAQVLLEADEEPVQCIFLAKDNVGYRSLVKVSSYIQQHSLDYMEAHALQPLAANLICILPSSHAKLERLLQEELEEPILSYLNVWKSFVGEGDFYLGIQNHGLEEEQRILPLVKEVADKYNIPVAAIQDVRYLQPKDDVAYDCLQSMKAGNKWGNRRISLNSKERYLKPAEEMEQLFAAWPEAIEATNSIMEKCNVEFDFTQRRLPSFPVPGGKEAHLYLEELCWDRAKRKYPTISQEIIDRLNYELNVIQTMDFSDYFLIVSDFIRYAKEQGILVGPGRGSAAGSLVAYVLGITDVDPLEYDLLFERFLNPERQSMPDIDIDFSDTRRDEVIDYVRGKYGDEHVAQIITFGTFAARSLLRELFKTMDIDQQDANFILKQVPVQSGKSLVETAKDSSELKQYIKQSDKLKVLFSVAAVLEGLPRHISTHAAGVVISEQSLVEHVPLTAGSNGVNLTQYPMNDLEELGLLKMDFLGLRNLTLLERVLSSIKYTLGEDIELEAIPDDDVNAFIMLQEGRTNGVFQLESQGMKGVLRRLQPTSFEDIVAVNALYRPGPMEFIPAYISRKNGQEEVSYPHPDLKEILAKTYGVLIYQEQIMQIANKIAGFSMGQADILRRAVSKKQRSVMQEQKRAFIDGCVSNGYRQEVAEEIFAWIVRFSNYGFNRSHAVAYSKISYQLAYLKANYPANFYAELLSAFANQQDKANAYIKEVNEAGIKVLPPSINKSFGRFSVEGDAIRIGLVMIKGIGLQVIREIIDNRKEGPYKSLFDFCLRVSLKTITRQVLETLIMAGAFDETWANRASLLASIDHAIEQGELFREFAGQSSLFQDRIALEEDYVEMEDFSQVKKLADEKEFLGIYISSHPLKEYRERLRESGCITIRSAEKLVDRHRQIKGAGIVQSLRTIRTKRGESMAFLTVGDETGDMEAVVFPELYRKAGKWLGEEAVLLMAGKIESRNNGIQWLLSEIQPFTESLLQPETEQRLFIKVTVQSNREALEKIKKTAESHPGSVPVMVYHEQRGQTYRLSAEYFLQPDYQCIKELRQFFGGENVVIQK
ncbi:DNA polymerase III subunit alpha [Virgibacillus sediminis]|uniref:DNA polymerase III subunit alpha n=1 Tax=Virgibacillus sediminis TaxID=202260 RepID=A0ABV7A6U8_9BACI